MMVMMIAITASLKASRRCLVIQRGRAVGKMDADDLCVGAAEPGDEQPHPSDVTLRKALRGSRTSRRQCGADRRVSPRTSATWRDPSGPAHPRATSGPDGLGPQDDIWTALL